MTLPTEHLANIPKEDSGIDAGYRHGPKHVTPGELIELKGTALKWYAVHPRDLGVPDEIVQLARSYLIKAEIEAKGLGFVILHRCGSDFYFLIVSTWRNNNELWETVFYKNGEGMADFAPFARDAMHKPTFCVWELVPLWHEKQAWERFLKSSRDEHAAQLWLHDCYAGAAWRLSEVRGRRSEIGRWIEISELDANFSAAKPRHLPSPGGAADPPKKSTRFRVQTPGD